MENKDKGDRIKDSPLDMLIVILLEGASKEVLWWVTLSSSSPSWREFDHEFLNPTSKGERSQTLNELLML